MKVIKADLSDIDRAVDLAYSLQDKTESRCRPLLLDVSRKDLYDIFKRYILRDQHELLLVENKGKIEGLTPIYWMEEDLYVSYSQGPYGYDYEAVAECLFDYVKEKFKGYKLYVNTAREHINSIKFYESKKFEKIEEAVMLKLEDFTSDYLSPFVQELNEDNSGNIFDGIEKQINEETYWNSRRISENIENFIILAYFDNGLQGHIIGRGVQKYTEIIAFSGDDQIKEDLLKSFISIANKRKVSLIDLYTEDDFEIKLGKKYAFNLYDTNNCYLRCL